QAELVGRLGDLAQGAVDLLQKLALLAVALRGQGLHHLRQRLLVFIGDADRGGGLAVGLGLGRGLPQHPAPPAAQRRLGTGPLRRRHRFFWPRRPGLSRAPSVPKRTGPEPAGSVLGSGASASRRVDNRPSEMRRFSRSTASTLTCSSSPTLTPSRAWRSGR